jgi:hypothetical protein
MPKRLLFIVTITLAALNLAAQPSVEKMLLDLPNDCLWLPKEKRMELMAYYRERKTDSVSNGMNGYCRITELNDSTGRMVLKTSSMGMLELQALTLGPTPCFGVIRTTCGPACDSRVLFLGTDRMPLQINAPSPDASAFLKTGLPQDDAALAQALLTPLFVSFTFGPDGSLTATCNARAFLSDGDWEKLKPMLATEKLVYAFANGIWTIRQ